MNTRNGNNIKWFFPYLIICCLFFIFFQDAPSSYMYPWDSELYVRLGTSILEGNWLGSFNELTLVKNIFLSLFIALLKLLKIKYNQGVLIFYFFSIFILLCSLKNLLWYQKLFLGISLIFLPENFSYYRQTIRREDLEVSYFLLICAMFCFLFKHKKNKIYFLIFIYCWCCCGH